ncbi:MAG: ATP synthase subunit I [bacterium]|jgi:hypothetical protein
MEPETPDSPAESRQLNNFESALEIKRLLIISSLILALVAAFLDLDYLLGSVLGSLVVGVNLHWTINFVQALLEGERTKSGLLALQLLKFGASALVLYLAINLLEISPIGLLLGLSNIVLAVALHSARRPSPKNSLT